MANTTLILHSNSMKNAYAKLAGSSGDSTYITTTGVTFSGSSIQFTSFSKKSSYYYPIYAYAINPTEKIDLTDANGNILNNGVVDLSSHTSWSIRANSSPPTPTTYSFTVQFDSQGGSAVSDLTWTASTSTSSHSLSGITSTKAGFTFSGWAESVGGTVISTVIATSGTTKTLYAVWSSSPTTTYTITYNANGGSGAPASGTKTKDINYDISTTLPTRSGWYFTEWNTEQYGEGTSYNPGAVFTGNYNLTLYAIWNLSPYLMLVLDKNGGAETKVKTNYGETPHTFTFTNSDKTTRDGKIFLGWSTSQSATSALYEVGDTLSISQSLVLYVVWGDPTPTYTYHLYLKEYNGSSITDYLYGPTTETSHQFTISATPSYIPSTKVWVGWNTSSGQSTATIGKTGSITLYYDDPTEYLYAALKDKITPFYYGNVSKTNDEAYVVKTGLPVSNITATAWNRFLDCVHEANSSFTKIAVNSGDNITANTVNRLRTGIDGMSSHGTLPSAVSSGDSLTAAWFNTLRDAYNVGVN